MFKHYDVEEIPTLADLSGSQKLLILDDFALGKSVNTIKHERNFHPAQIKEAFAVIIHIESLCDRLMREDILITPIEYDPETGEVTAEAVYNTQPSTEAALKDEVHSRIDEWADSAINIVINKMLNYSKKDGTGDFAFYKSYQVLEEEVTHVISKFTHTNIHQ